MSERKRSKRGASGRRTAPGWRRAVPWLFLVGPVLLALALRVAYFLQIRTSPFFHDPVFDARLYAARAARIAGGAPVLEVAAEGPRMLPLHGPAYPVLLSILSRFSGHDFAVMTFANALLGVATALLLGLAGRRLLPGPVGPLAATLWALLWIPLHFEGHLLATAWFTFLLVAAMTLLVRRGAVSIAAAGLVLGVATLTRPNALAVVPFLVAALAAWPARRSAWLSRLRDPALLMAGLLIVVGPVLVRNHSLCGSWALQSNTAFNLYLGNHPGSPGTPGVRPGRDWDELANAPQRAGVTTQAEHDRWFRERVRAFAREDPLGFARLQARKALLLLNHREARTTLSPYFFERFAPLQASPFLLGFGLLGPWALVGMALTVRRLREFALPWIFTLPPALLVVATVIGSRYRTPLLPFLALFAAFAVVETVRAMRSRRGRRLAVIGALLVPAAWVVHLRFDDLEVVRYGEETARVASVLQARGDADAAAVWWEESLREEPDRTETYVTYASLALAKGDFAKLERVTAAGLRSRGDDWLLLMFRGRALLELGRPEESLGALRPVLASRPADPDLLAGIARAHAAAGRPDSSLHWFRRALPTAGPRIEVWKDAAAALLDSAARLPSEAARRDRLQEAGAALAEAWKIAPGRPDLQRLADRFRSLGAERPGGSPPPPR